jgi:oligopeptidase B
MQKTPRHKMSSEPRLLAPKAKQILAQDRHHGISRQDEYAWLRDDNWQAVMKHPEQLQADIRQHLEAENAYTEQVLAPAKHLQQDLFTEMRARLQEDDASVPMNEGSLSWASRYAVGGEHPHICYGPRDANLDDMQVIMNGDAEAEGRDFFKLAAYEADRQGRLLAWSFDDKGSEYFTICLRDMHTGQDQKTRLLDTTGSMAWSACGEFLFYVGVDENHRPSRILRHAIGSSQGQDVCIYEEADAGFFIGLSSTRSGRFLVVSAHDHETSEAWLVPTDAPLSPPQCVATRRAGIEYDVDDDSARDRLVIVTNWDGAQKADDFQIVTAALPLGSSDTSPELAMDNWQVLRAHRAGCLILDAMAFAEHLVILLRENALPRLEIISPDGGDQQQIDFEEEAFDLSLGAMAEYDTTCLRFTYASMTSPTMTFDYDMASRQRQLRKTQIIPSGHDPADYITRRLSVTGHDGVQIPVSVLYHKDTKLDASAPVLLYGYGSYGITIPASFSVTRLSLVDRGFIYAIAHIRGGKACGHNWFMQGRGPHKTNTFEDFVSVARELIARGWTREKQITIHGGSAGGLLVGASLNLAPDLFCGAVAEVPFVDVLTTMLDATLPLTPPEWPEWGNPIESRDAYQLIAGYAPYENIAATAYPHVLATAGLTDPRVTYWEPAKWIARLRDRRTDPGYALLRTEMTAGHGGKAGRYNQLHEVAFVYSFVLTIHEKHNHG